MMITMQQSLELLTSIHCQVEILEQITKKTTQDITMCINAVTAAIKCNDSQLYNHSKAW